MRVSVDGCSTESDPTTVVGVEEMVSAGIRVYPNPSGSSVHIELPSAYANARADLFTTTGVRKETVLLSSVDGRSRGELNVKDYADGIYMIVITTGRGVIAKKFQKR